MKTKVYKLLSILVALAILATTFLTVIGTVPAAAEDQLITEENGGETGEGSEGEEGEEGEEGPVEIVYPENSYFISAKGKTVPANRRPEGVGTLENPVKTFSDVTRLIKADGYTAEDTVYVFIKSGEQVNWTDDSNLPVNYSCKVVIDSTNPEERGTLYEYDFLDMVGDMTFKNVNFTVEYMYGCARMNHYDIVFDEGSVVSIPEFFIGSKGAPSKYNEEYNLEIRGEFKTNKFFLMSNFSSGTYEKDINIFVDNENAVLPFLFTGYRPENKFTYNGNINITVLNAKTMSFANHQGVSVFNGALQVRVASNVKMPYSIKTNFNQFEFAGGKWFLTVASEINDFVQLSTKPGEFNIKDKATAYIRQFGGQLITDKDGVVDLTTKSGVYTISDKPIDELLDDSRKMAYFKCPGGNNTLLSFAEVTPGETYRFEYSIYTSHFEDSYPTCRVDGDRKVMGDDMVIISNEAVDNYYKVVAEITIPETYNPYPDKPDKVPLAFFGVALASSSMGVTFDRKVYNVNDPGNNLIRNPNLHEGLDHLTLNFDFWGAVYTNEKGGTGFLDWTNGVAELAIMDVDYKFIDHLIYLADPDDGEWWNPEDYIEETFETFADAVGIFVDQDENPIKGVKFLLVSEDKSYTSKTNAKGEFKFSHILTGFYDLFFVDGKEKIATGFSAYIGQDDIVRFNIVSDLRNLLAEQEQNEEQIIPDTTPDETPDEEIVGDPEEEIIPTGNFAGTVYTPLLETVSNLKIVLGDIGEVVTDANGSFAFANIPVGTYDLYTVLADGSKYVLTQVSIEENRDINSKLKFAPAVESDTNEPADNGWIVWVIVASSVALVVVAGLIVLLIFKKRAA